MTSRNYINLYINPRLNESWKLLSIINKKIHKLNSINLYFNIIKTKDTTNHLLLKNNRILNNTNQILLFIDKILNNQLKNIDNHKICNTDTDIDKTDDIVNNNKTNSYDENLDENDTKNMSDKVTKLNKFYNERAKKTLTAMTNSKGNIKNINDSTLQNEMENMKTTTMTITRDQNVNMDDQLNMYT